MSDTVTPPRAQVPPTGTGIWPRMRARLFGEKDAVAAQLAEVARQGSGMAHLAHACAFALVVLFSLGSLVALSGEQLTRIIRLVETGQGLDIPAAISVAVSTLLVVCFDVGMVYAALKVRMLRARRQGGEAWPHVLVMIVVCAIEAGTYLYMSVTYDTVSSLAVLALIVARAISAPVMSIYLSMAAPSPVSARDVLYQTELAVGEGLIRDAVTVARDSSAPLAQKMRLYKAASPMSPDDRARLDGMIAVMADSAASDAGRITLPIAASASESHDTAIQDGSHAASSAADATTPADVPAPAQRVGDRADAGDDTPDTPETPPTGPGSPSAAPRRRGNVTEWPAQRRTADRSRSAGRKVAQGSQGSNGRSKGSASWEADARRAWADGAHSIRSMRAAVPGMSQAAASKWVATMKAGDGALVEALAQ